MSSTTIPLSLSSCLHGLCTVKMANGTTKLVKDVVKGDQILSSDGSIATVRFVLKTLIPARMIRLVEFPEGLMITPWHPMIYNNNWTFPCYINNSVVVDCTEVFSFAMWDQFPTIEVNGHRCATLGHHLIGPVIGHPYFGTSAVINDLIQLDIDNDGLVTITPDWIVRQNGNGLVCKIRNPGGI